MELLLLKLIHLFARGVLLVKKLEIEETKTTDIIKVGLVFSISNFFITKTSLANKWRSKQIPSFGYLALAKVFSIVKDTAYLPTQCKLSSIFNKHLQ